MTEFARDRAADAAPGPPCPPWCDGWHGADDRDAVFHAALIARIGDVSVAMSLMQPRDPALPADGPVILLIGSGDDVQSLTPADAARLLTERESADQADPLARAVRSALARLGLRFPRSCTDTARRRLISSLTPDLPLYQLLSFAIAGGRVRCGM